jgi:hypothetical protein
MPRSGDGREEERRAEAERDPVPQTSSRGGPAAIRRRHRPAHPSRLRRRGRRRPRRAATGRVSANAERPRAARTGRGGARGEGRRHRSGREARRLGLTRRDGPARVDRRRRFRQVEAGHRGDGRVRLRTRRARRRPVAPMRGLCDRLGLRRDGLGGWSRRLGLSGRRSRRRGGLLRHGGLRRRQRFRHDDRGFRRRGRRGGIRVDQRRVRIVRRGLRLCGYGWCRDDHRRLGRRRFAGRALSGIALVGDRLVRVGRNRRGRAGFACGGGRRLVLRHVFIRHVSRRRVRSRSGLVGRRAERRWRRRGLGCAACRQEPERIDVPLGLARPPDSKVHVRHRDFGDAARPDAADDLALGDRLPAVDGRRSEMQQRQGPAVRCSNRDGHAVRRQRPGVRDHTGGWSGNAFAPTRSNVDAAMLATRIRILSEHERPHDGPADRPAPGRRVRRQHERQ